ncbi:glutathione S-transferase family protein [Kangiella geojedonensis]|uniref:Glutathione S-transferase domain protein n=1 Tax=Kangiella geojedonensis TaxID=914150 RepID=A0A0F6TS24_9GAMM|nr:glutathione S-transferase family protein [Kangiella geojedonensis]AKE53039.1 Glutathione S-transferase domain protein [Kangiella geojedonensis]
MKLIYSDASPYARTARMVVRELGLGSKVQEVAYHPFDNPKELIDANPLCKVPCLIDDNGMAIFDSQIMGEYLDDYATIDKPLFADVNNSWQLKTLYSLTRGLLDTAVALQQDKMRGEGQSEFWQERFYSALDRGLAYLQKHLASFPKQFEILSINTVALVSYLKFRHPEYTNLEGFTKLNMWFDEQQSRPSVSQTAPK